MSWRAILAAGALFGCRGGQELAETPERPDPQASFAAEHAMSGPLAEDPHLRLTAPRAPGPGDSARAARVVAQLRAAVDRYRDVRVAEADGFREFLPGVPQPVSHFTSRRHALAAMLGFDAARPTSLLYRRHPDGAAQLVGAMYTAPAREGEDELNARLPLSVIRWHQHVNWCIPPRHARARWRETRDGRPVFGPKSPIATAEACAAVGGTFLPRIFGWMVHVEFGRDGAAHAH